MKSIISIKTIVVALVIVMASSVIMNGCKAPEEITSKSGTQLWGENCTRCHDAPDPHTFSDDQWDVAIEHMHQKALLTDTEVKKIVTFMKSAN